LRNVNTWYKAEQAEHIFVHAPLNCGAIDNGHRTGHTFSFRHNAATCDDYGFDPI
jgi:hypothetical protein